MLQLLAYSDSRITIENEQMNYEVIFVKNIYSLIPGPLSVTIENCETVSTEGQAFSWLLNMNITNVGTMQLGPGSFTLDPSASNVGEHGPGMSVSISSFQRKYTAWRMNYVQMRYFNVFYLKQSFSQ